MNDIWKKIRNIFVNDPSYHYYYTEPVDKRGSTTYPPDDSGPSDFVIYAGFLLIAVAAVKGIRKIRSCKR